jgi:hypothetical protein
MAAARILVDSASSTSSRRLDGSPGPADDDAERIRRLERQVDNLHQALHSQRLIGMSIGIIAQRHGCTCDEARDVLRRLSQHTNCKVREVARVLVDAYDGRARAEDAALLVRLAAELPADPGRSPERAHGPDGTAMGDHAPRG